MKALVTGATGFVGTHLVEALRRHGHDVTALVRSPGKAAHLAQLGITQAAGDLSDAVALERAARAQDVVFHVAGLTAARSEAEFLAVNRDGTARVLEAATRGRVPRFVLMSSLAAAGPSAPGRPHADEEARRPVTAYGRSKLAAETVVRNTSSGWTILRPPMVYGPWDREILKVFRTARRGVAPVFGDGTQELSAVHGADLAEAAIACAIAPGAVGRTYYPCHPRTFTSAAFARAVGTALGRRVTVVHVPEPVGRILLGAIAGAARLAGRATILGLDKANEFFETAWTCDPTPCTRATGWASAMDLEAGLTQTAQWYRSAGWI